MVWINTPLSTNTPQAFSSNHQHIHIVYQDVLRWCERSLPTTLGVVILTFTRRGGSNYSTPVHNTTDNTAHNTVHSTVDGTTTHLGPLLPAQYTPTHLGPPHQAQLMPAQVARTQLRVEQVASPSCASQCRRPVPTPSKSKFQTVSFPVSFYVHGVLSHLILRLWQWFVTVDVDRSGSISASELRESCFRHPQTMRSIHTRTKRVVDREGAD